MKLWWFNTIAKQLIKDHYFGQYLKCSYQWFARFFRRFKVTFRWVTHTAETAPKDLAPAISKLHARLLCVRRSGNFELKDIASMNQTRLPFVFDGIPHIRPLVI